MNARRSPSFCAACGHGTQANHRLLWLESSSDVLTLWSPARAFPTFYGLFSRIGEAFASLLGRAAFYAAKALGIVRLTSDAETATSNRSRLLWQAAFARGIRMEQLLFFGNPTDTFRVSHAGRSQFFKSLPLTPSIEALRMDDKVAFKEAMRAAGLPVPRSYSASNVRRAEQALDELKLVCVKPRTGSNSRHTYPYVHSKEDLRTAFASAKQICIATSVEEHLEGNLCRATCIGGAMIGFLESEHPAIVGDGTSTVEELIAAKNAAKREGVADVVLDGSLVSYIGRRGYRLDSVLPEGVRLQLSFCGGVAAGGGNREHGRAIHPSFFEPIEEAARLTGLDIVGFDLIIPDPFSPASEQRWGFVEANTLPWIDLHATPFRGEPIDLSPYVWNLWLTGRGGGTR